MGGQKSVVGIGIVIGIDTGISSTYPSVIGNVMGSSNINSPKPYSRLEVLINNCNTTFAANVTTVNLPILFNSAAPAGLRVGILNNC